MSDVRLKAKNKKNKKIQLLNFESCNNLFMAPRGQSEDKPEALRDLVRFIADQNKIIMEQQNKTNCEVRRLSYVVYGDKDNDIPGLVGDNTRNNELRDEVSKWKNRLIGASFVLGGLLTWLGVLISKLL